MNEKFASCDFVRYNCPFFRLVIFSRNSGDPAYQNGGSRCPETEDKNIQMILKKDDVNFL